MTQVNATSHARGPIAVLSELNFQASRKMEINFRGLLLAAALSLCAMAAFAAGDVVVYKDAT